MYRPPSYWFNIATDATKALNQLDSSQEPGKLVFFLTSLPLDGSLPVHHTAFWQSGLSSAWLNAILDRSLYQSFAVDHPVDRPESAIPILSERSASALVTIIPRCSYAVALLRNTTLIPLLVLPSETLAGDGCRLPEFVQISLAVRRKRSTRSEHPTICPTPSILI